MATLLGLDGKLYEEAPEIAAERQRLHDACWDAYERTGSVRTPEWRAAAKALDDFRTIHGWEYNPD